MQSNYIVKFVSCYHVFCHVVCFCLISSNSGHFFLLEYLYLVNLIITFIDMSPFIYINGKKTKYLKSYIYICISHCKLDYIC